MAGLRPGHPGGADVWHIAKDWAGCEMDGRVERPAMTKNLPSKNSHRPAMTKKKIARDPPPHP
jgi:hypothetical protein